MEERIEFGLRALRRENFRALCREYGITARTGYKWRERFERWGKEGMVEESRRPRSSPAALGEREVCEIVRLKEAHRRWGPRKIRELYLRLHGEAASESSFKRVLERGGLTEQRKRRRPAAKVGSTAVSRGRPLTRCGQWTSKAGGIMKRGNAVNR
jgi:transposase